MCELPVVMGDRSQLVQVVQNQIGDGLNRLRKNSVLYQGTTLVVP